MIYPSDIPPSRRFILPAVNSARADFLKLTDSEKDEIDDYRDAEIEFDKLSDRARLYVCRHIRGEVR